MEGKFNYFGTLSKDTQVADLVEKLPITPIVKHKMTFESTRITLSELAYTVFPDPNIVDGDYIITPVKNEYAQVKGYYGADLPFAFQEDSLSVIYEGKNFTLKPEK